jgi:uncharacterized glyoxalase superfamily protein PhnB
MATVKSIPEGVQAVFPMLVCQSPEAEMNFCATAFEAVEQVRRPGPDGSPIHMAMRINDAFLVIQAEVPDLVVSRAHNPDGSSPLVIFVYVADVDQAVERAVAMGAKSSCLPRINSGVTGRRESSTHRATCGLSRHESKTPLRALVGHSRRAATSLTTQVNRGESRTRPVPQADKRLLPTPARCDHEPAAETQAVR